MNREPNTEYILSLSYGKDSLACLEAIKQFGYPLDRIIHAEVWATDTIPADLPPMVEFKEKADKVIFDRYGIKVEHVCAVKNGEKLTYEKLFYSVPKRRKRKDLQGGVRFSNAKRTMVSLSQIQNDTGSDTVFQEEQCHFVNQDSREMCSTKTCKENHLSLKPHCTRGEEKYCTVFRNCIRRTRKNYQTHKTRHCFTAGRHWLGRSILQKMV